MKNYIIIILIAFLPSCKKYEMDTERSQESVKNRLCDKIWYCHGTLDKPAKQASDNGYITFYRGGDFYQRKEQNNTYQGFDPVVLWKLSLDRETIYFKCNKDRWEVKIFKLSEDSLAIKYSDQKDILLYTINK